MLRRRGSSPSPAPPTTWAGPSIPRTRTCDGRYGPWRAYGQAKLANFHFGLGLDRLLRKAGAPAASLVAHPGLSNTELQAVSVEETDGGLSQRFFLMLARSVGMSPGEGALSQLRAATDPGAKGGEFYGPLFVNNGPPVRKPILRRLGMSRAIERLWQVSERETGLKRRCMNLGLEDRVALVMGASRGIGRAIAAALAREGAKVAIASRSSEKLDEAAAEIGGAATPFVADASDLDRLAALPGEVEEALGPVEILVANTGGPPFGGALDHELNEWESAYRSLVLAPRVLAERSRARNARARLGPDRQRRLQLNP